MGATTAATETKVTVMAGLTAKSENPRILLASATTVPGMKRIATAAKMYGTTDNQDTENPPEI
jgi:CO dehydrogenase/acetyl-CoA synthase delta subunit